MRSHLVQSRARLQHVLSRCRVSSAFLKENGSACGASNQEVRPECQADVRMTSNSPSFSTPLFNSLSGGNCSKSSCHSPDGGRRYATQTATKEGAEGVAGDIEVQIQTIFNLHMLEKGPPQEARTSKEELMYMYRQMSTIRRMEITADMLFKSQFIRGFCHLYDGQEAVTIGMEAALTFEDSVLTAYRDHGTFIGRGGTLFHVHEGCNSEGPFELQCPEIPRSYIGCPELIYTGRTEELNSTEAFSELMGKKTGAAFGKGGSMHMYKIQNNFYGGWGIVGTSGPLGTGIGLANKYLKTNRVVVAIYGDGAGNQGQLYEAQNIAALMDLPVIYLVENNHYGMGTAEYKASKKATYFDRLNYIPGIKVDGMDVFAMKNAFLFAKEFCLAGKGPIVLEADTYRYHGHSMSDPGSSYRERSEIQGMRKSRDPIEHVRKIILKEEVSTEEELKNIDKEIKREVEEASAKAKEAPLPTDDELFSNIYQIDTGLVTYGCDRSNKVKLP